MARTRTSLHSSDALRDLLEDSLPARFEDLEVPFGCVAACIETAHERWFTEGPLVPAVLASCAVPGLLPAVRLGDEHFIDGGVIDSIPVRRAIDAGATTIYVLQVGEDRTAVEPTSLAPRGGRGGLRDRPAAQLRLDAGVVAR
ncbi:MAG: patatin-like phospholipase family protein [Microthrixaceae bacterium]